MFFTVLNVRSNLMYFLIFLHGINFGLKLLVSSNFNDKWFDFHLR